MNTAGTPTSATLINRTLSGFTACLMFILLLILSNIAHAEDDTVVLIASKDSDITEIALIDLRRVYLGIAPHGNTPVNEPILNMTDRKIYNDFLKNIMRMTDNGYRKKVVKRIFRRGATYIKEAFSNEEIFQHLEKNKNNICFIRKSDLTDQHQAKIIMTLW